MNVEVSTMNLAKEVSTTSLAKIEVGYGREYFEKVFDTMLETLKQDKKGIIDNIMDNAVEATITISFKAGEFSTYEITYIKNNKQLLKELENAEDKKPRK